MNKFTVAFLWMISIITGAYSQQFDTSILKNGNTWVYKSQSSGGGGIGVIEPFTYSGTIKFTLDSLEKSGDTLKFKVTREDTGSRTSDWWGPSNPHSISTTQYALYNNSIIPSVPLFASEQNFSGTETKSIYRGDTLLYRTTPPDNFNNCAPRKSTNLEGVGRTEDSYSFHCGHTYGSEIYRLIEHNGSTYSADSVLLLTTTAVNPISIKIIPASTGIRLQKNQIIFSNKKGVYDLKGQKASMPTKR